MAARIYKPAKNAMQQGMAARPWVLEYEPDKPLLIEPLMGWTSSADTKSQVRLPFATKEEAVAFAMRHGIAFRLEEPQRDGAETEILRREFQVRAPRPLDALTPARRRFGFALTGAVSGYSPSRFEKRSRSSRDRASAF